MRLPWSDSPNEWSKSLRLIVDIIGLNDARIISMNFDGANIDIPKCDRFWTAWNHEVICSSSDISQVELARTYGYSDRHIRRILKQAKKTDNQIDMFNTKVVNDLK